MVRVSPGSPSQWIATLSPLPASTWRSRQLSATLSCPPTNHFGVRQLPVEDRVPLGGPSHEFGGLAGPEALVVLVRPRRRATCRGRAPVDLNASDGGNFRFSSASASIDLLLLGHGAIVEQRPGAGRDTIDTGGVVGVGGPSETARPRRCADFHHEDTFDGQLRNTDPRGAETVWKSPSTNDAAWSPTPPLPSSTSPSPAPRPGLRHCPPLRRPPVDSGINVGPGTTRPNELIMNSPSTAPSASPPLRPWTSSSTASATTAPHTRLRAGHLDTLLPVRERLTELLDDDVVATTRWSGGDVAEAYRIELRDGRTVFVKTHRSPPPGFFTTEASGLSWLRDAGAVAVPDVLGVSDGDEASDVPLPRPGVDRRDRRRLGSSGRRRASAVSWLRSIRLGSRSFGRADRRTTGSRGLPNEPCATWAEFYATPAVRTIDPARGRTRRRSATSISVDSPLSPDGSTNSEALPNRRHASMAICGPVTESSTRLGPHG